MNYRTTTLDSPRATALPSRTDPAIVPDRAGPVSPPAGSTERVIAVVAILALVAINVVGFFAALTLIVASLLLLALAPGDSLRTLLRFSPLLALPVLAAVSTLWSDAPAQSLKLGLELILTAVAAILMCRNTSPRTLILVMFVGLLPICLATLAWVPQTLASGFPMNAYFGSKNELGMMAQLLFALSLAIILDRQRGAALRWLSVAAVALALGMLVLSQSVTAQVCVAITAIAFPVLLLFGRLPMSVRVGSVVLLFVALGAALPFIGSITSEIEEFRGTVLNKDATLTGRTYLWDFADKISAERPWLGHGYGAFWRPGNIDAEALWRWGGVANKSGFNFHNAFVEIQVALGLVGVIMLALTCAAVLLLAMVRHIWRPSVPTAFIVTINLVFYIRSYSEVGLIAPFSFITVLWLGSAVYAVNEHGRGLPFRREKARLSVATARDGPVPSRQTGVPQTRHPGPTSRRG